MQQGYADQTEIFQLGTEYTKLLSAVCVLVSVHALPGGSKRHVRIAQLCAGPSQSDSLAGW